MRVKHLVNKRGTNRKRLAGAGEGIRTLDVLLGKDQLAARLVNNMSVSELATLTNLSKSYISQVKRGKLPPSQKVVDALILYINDNRKHPDYMALLLFAFDL